GGQADWHLHLRDEQALAYGVADSARQDKRAIIMPNLVRPVTTTAQDQACHQHIETAMQNPDAAKADDSLLGFEPLMTLYLTDKTSAEEIIRAKESSLVYAVKLYPAGATTNSDAGVTDLLANCSAVLEQMQKVGMPLLVHGEVTDPS